MYMYSYRGRRLCQKLKDHLRGQWPEVTPIYDYTTNTSIGLYIIIEEIGRLNAPFIHYHSLNSFLTLFGGTWVC